MSINNTQNSDVDNEMDRIEIRLVKDWSIDEIVELYKVGGWWQEHYDPSGIPGLIKGSFVFAVAVDRRSNSAVGMARAVSDGVSDAYIQDVVVLKTWRRKGIGIKLVEYVLNHCLRNGLHWIGLIAEPGTRSFYKPMGFKELPGVPMVFKPEDKNG
jgi:GNAT superfamily N-acetyltransferase